MSRTGRQDVWPGWVPDQAMRYLAHTLAGLSIRDLARQAACHPSTVLRQIRRLETRRDDPLVDDALRRLGERYAERGGQLMAYAQLADRDDEDTTRFEREATRVLRRLCETGAVLALAADMDKAVVVRDGPDGTGARTAVVERDVAEALALNDWIACAGSGRILRYGITAAGRAELGRLMAEAESSRAANANGFAEKQAGFAGERDGRRSRYGMAESPLSVLSRRKDHDGEPFLSDDLVAAGERLREDFELAQLQPGIAQNWDRFLTGPGRGNPAGSGLPQLGANPAQDRVLAALQALGPGLSDVALRCCCFLEGLELAEKRLGWSARSGKIVLRIALQQLKRHYASQTLRAHLIG